MSQQVPPQENLTVVSVPEEAILGKNIILNVQNIRDGFERCEWTPPFGPKIDFDPNSKVVDASQVGVVHRNCSLSITNLRSEHRGKYTIKVSVPSANQQGTRGPDVYIGSIFLTFCEQIRINVEPQNPRVGQNVKMTPVGLPDRRDYCEWEQKTQNGIKKFEDSEEEPDKQKNQQPQVTPKDCSFHMTQLTLAHSGTYSVYSEVYLDQNSGKEGRRTKDQMKCYRGQTQLKVQVSGSASVKYSAGIIAAALLGSLTWTTSSLSLLPLLFGK
ncbi:PREDICTED: uncharacterized protein LOC106547644 [Thamnophis sirtalis]|uniref:Uncharacterized protein LOC106547644 n=1 Tax=Thamnophis sirtalis TaxID=35019 RepID=A0A6I9YAF7_9SAUR|nr:PREDICTED: uncharacterized protein LOC106547644 [Thamnophis sirtalis]